jgi:hypothetical protein
MSNDKLYYYSKSKDIPPSKGIYETINDIKDYEELEENTFKFSFISI